MAQFETIMKECLTDLKVNYKGQFCGLCKSEEEIESLFTRLKCVGYSYSARSSNRQKPSDASSGTQRFLFQLLQGDVEIAFNGSPFTVEYTCYRQCTLGPKYFDKYENSVPDHLADHVNPIKRRKLLLDTKKCDCPATFLVKCVRFYPGYSVQSVSDHSMKKKVVDSLKQHLELPDKPESLLHYYVVVSPPNHHTHSTDIVKVNGELHPCLAGEIINHVKNGTSSIKIIKLLLERFVDATFTGPDRPDRINKTFLSHRQGYL